MISKKEMKVLKESIGKKVKVYNTFYGSHKVTKGTLEEVVDFGYIKVDGTSMPFVGCSGAIEKIIRIDNALLYESPLISFEFDLRDDTVRKMVCQLTFGKRIALEHQKKWKAMKKSANL